MAYGLDGIDSQNIPSQYTKGRLCVGMLHKYVKNGHCRHYSQGHHNSYYNQKVKRMIPVSLFTIVLFDLFDLFPHGISQSAPPSLFILLVRLVLSRPLRLQLSLGLLVILGCVHSMLVMIHQVEPRYHMHPNSGISRVSRCDSLDIWCSAAFTI